MNEPLEQKPIEKSDKQKEDENGLVISFLALRNLIGISGMLLPVILAIFTPKGENDKVMEYSISEYYYTRNGDILVVLLCVIGVFLLTYKGYRFWERTLTTVAAICGIGVAFFPTATKVGNSLSIHIIRGKVPELIHGVQWHFVFAGTFFICLAIISLHYFPQSNPDDIHFDDPKHRRQKARRNFIYKLSGWVMLGCVAAMILYLATEPAWLANKPVVFVLETIAIEAFGISWLTKGQTLYPDGEHYITKGLRQMKQAIQNR